LANLSSGNRRQADGELCLNPENGFRCIKKCYGENWKEKILKRWRESKEVIEKSDAVVSPTYFLASTIQKITGKKIKVIRHGVDYSNINPNKRLKQKEDRVIIGYIGSILPHKGVHIAVRAMKHVKARNIELRIYGNYFHAKKYFEELLKIAEKDSRIKFMGEYKDEDLNTIMNEVDCTIQPSIWWENSPLTVLISLAYKVPVITTNLGGAAELVKDGINGFNFEIGDAKSLANIIEKIAEDPTILNEVKKKIVRPPRKEEEAFEYEKLYRELVNS
jgi:glycosyltransferase involved in cell wall biosynthesis